MLGIHTTNLPADQRKRLHPDFLANEQAYLRMRDSLLPQYRGQWVAIESGQVVATGDNVLDVSEAAAAHGGHPYIARVGEEEAVVFRVRRAVFAYDQNYQPFPLPRITVIFSDHAETASRSYSDVIADTGADLSLLPDGDCTSINLYNSPYFTAMSGGVVGTPTATLVYRGKAEIDRKRLAALIQPVAGGQERIVGRDVLNQLRVLFDGPAGQVTVDP